MSKGWLHQAIGYLWLLVLALIVLEIGFPHSIQAAASITFEIVPERPIAGRRANLVVRTWLPDANGYPDQTNPVDTAGYPFSIRAYRAAEFRVGSVPGTAGFPITIEQVATNTWRGQVVFPEPGSWVIVFRNWYPPLTATLPPPEAPATLNVEVLPAATTLPTTGSVRALPVYVLLVGLGALTVGLSFRSIYRIITSRDSIQYKH